MKNGILNLFFSLFLITFSLIWVSDKLAIVIENEKYSYYETTEKSDTENKTENKLKTLFINHIDFLDLVQFSFPNTIKNNSAYSFKIKEFCFENLTPPPEQV